MADEIAVAPNLKDHPLYGSEPLVADLTDSMLAFGSTIFQIYQMPIDEPDHAAWLLRLADPEMKCERVLSLGCGVGGLEAYWNLFRPKMRFELVNTSKAQLKRCFCRGRKICADATSYVSKQPKFDMVILCYLLGHVQIEKTLESALENLAPWGTMLIYDVFEGSQNFDLTLFYNTPYFHQIERFGLSNNLRFRHVVERGIPLGKYFKEHAPWAALESSPGLFVFQRDGSDETS